MSMQDHERAFYAIGKAVVPPPTLGGRSREPRDTNPQNQVLETWLDPDERRLFNRYGQLDFGPPGAHVKPLMVWDNDGDEIPF